MRGAAVSRSPQFFKRNLIILISFVFVAGVLSFVSAAEEISEITFDPDFAGPTPDKWYYGIYNFFNDPTPEQFLAQAGLMAQKGDYDATKQAFENFADAVDSQNFNLENVNIEEITVDDLKSEESLKEVYEAQADLLNYQLQIDSISEILSENGEEFSVIDEVTNAAEDSIANVGSVVEEKTSKAIEVAAENSGLPKIEASFAVEEGFSTVAGERYPETSPRFKEVADIQDVQEIKVKINQLREEVRSLGESGDVEKAKVAMNLLNMAESHGVNCLHATEQELGITAEIHLNAAENFLAEAENLIVGETEVSELTEEIEEVKTTEEIVAEVKDEQKEVEVFAGNYETLQEKYAEDPIKLAVLDAENERLQRVDLLGKALEEDEVIEGWKSELIAEGVEEGEELDVRINERLVNELNYIDGDGYIPPGVFVAPGEEVVSNEKVIGQELEVIPIGRIDVIEKINPETGVVTKEFVGWADGVEIENLEQGGGFALGIEYKDPSTENKYTFGSVGYSYTTPAGVTYVVDYPADYSPSSEKEYQHGDEVFSYATENGDIMTYSAVGYKISDSESGEVLQGGSYVSDVTFSGGEVADFDATGYSLISEDGKLTTQIYSPETESYLDPLSGKVFVPETPSSHAESTSYVPSTGKYETIYAGKVWTTDGSGTWTSPTGQQYNYATVPVPIGYENKGEWITPSGKQWNYDSETGTWIDSTTGASYTPAPNNYYRYTDTGYFTDYKGNTLAPVGTQVDVDGKNYFVDSQLGWATTDDNGNKIAVAPPAGQPSSATGSGGYGGGSYYASAWNYNSVSREWVSGSTGDRYDSATGTITHPDGTTSKPEDRAAGEGTEGGCYGCYYSYGGPESSTEGPKAYTYEGGHYGYNPTSGKYDYVDGNGNVQIKGDTSGKSADGIKWSLQGNEWFGTKEDGTKISASQYASEQAAARGVEARASVGTMVKGDDGRTYSVTQDRGWTDDSGKAVAPPTVGGIQQPSSAVGSNPYSSYASTPGYMGSTYSGGSPQYGYGAPSGGYGGYGYYTGGGGYDPSGKYVGGEYGGYDSSGNPSGAASMGGYYGGGYGPSAYGGYAQYGGSPSGGYYGAPAGGYTAEMDSAAQAAGYADAASAAAAYSSGSYSGGSYSGDGSYSGGSYSGGDSGSYSGGSYSGGSTSGGDSGGSTGGSTGGDSGGSTGGSTGGDGGGSSTGAVITDIEVDNNWLAKFLKKIFGNKD